MTESEKKFPVTKDQFHTSPKTLENLEDESIWRTIAQDYFNESAEEINSKVQILKDKILELDLKLPRQDDLFLLKFLRAGGGDLEVALKVVQAYIEIMEQNPIYFAKLSPISKLDHVFQDQINTMTESRDEFGRRLYIFRPGLWNPSSSSFAEVFAAGFVLAEMVSEEAKSQVAGMTLVADADGFGFKHLRNFSLSDAKTMSAFLQSSFPLWFRSMHVVNAPKLFMVAFGMVKPFMPEYVQNNIHFHANYQELHSIVSKDVLPEELGGNDGKFDNSKCVEHSKTLEEYFKKLEQTSS